MNSKKDMKRLRLVRGKYFYNRRVPKELLSTLNVKNFLRSLQTDSYQKALMGRNSYNVYFDKLLNAERSNPLLADKLEELEGLTEDSLRQELERWDEEVRGDYSYEGHREWDPNDPYTPPMPDKDKIAYIALKRRLGEPISKELEQVAEKSRLTLKQALAKVIEEKKADGLPHKSLLKYSRASELFHQITNRETHYVYSLNRGAVRTFIRLCKEDGKHHKTIKGYLSPLSVIWKYVRDYEELNNANPFTEWDSQFSQESTPYQNWTTDELKKILTCCEQERDKLMIYIGWYTGARIDEIYTLTSKTIHTEKETGIRYFYFKEFLEEKDKLQKKTQSGKNKVAKRKTPIHKNLEEMLEGFTGFDSRPSSDAYSKAFGLAKRRAGYQDKGREYAFHSLRGNCSTNLENLECPENIVDRITGHTAGNSLSFQRYSKGVTLEVMNKYIQQLPNL
jgi:integrase